MIIIENSELNNEWGFFIDTEIDESYHKNVQFEKIDMEEGKKQGDNKNNNNQEKQYNKKESKYIKKIPSLFYYGTTFLVSFSLTYCICCIL